MNKICSRRRLLAEGTRGVVAAAAAALGGSAAGLMSACAQVAPAPSVPGMPPLARPGLLRVGVTSCADQNEPQPVWDAALAMRPDFFIFAGDNVYASDPPATQARLRAAYDALGAKPGFQRLRQAVPHLAVWDDHDYGLNDGGAGWELAQVAKDEFLRFWRVSETDPRRTRAGVYHAQMLAAGEQRVQVIGLDTRWFRSPLKPTDQRGAMGKERYLPDPDPAKTMLGAAQWRWLEERLAMPADAHLIVSSIQCVAEGHGWERWGNLPLERERLFRTIRTSGARGVVLVSGDRHIGGIYRHAGPELNYPLWEMTSSGATKIWSTANEPGPNRVGPLVTVNHHGIVSVDVAAGELKLSLLDLGNRVLQEQSIALAHLRAG